MKPQNPHAQEDRLLDFAYGELPVPEARLVEAHLESCARCTQALDDIRGVRATMSQLSVEPAPDAGLESLMAYAQQAARRAAAGPAPKPSRWRRWLLPVVGRPP
ncbi:zf-HC2 domain-containing protein [Myxococcus sp. MxC21-1]|uniref:anti-sigma factor family protein n=1 Tax=Myxococcus sp. MxC21-1 TaxID=3041439 RepID=UPI00292F31B4|nr:zf-HC2 domain-containing protein [Myxococcus sp. MxC21-1]WNZ59366.1 zf-HC2 domain-containing protein [Myxococcus sp. MxC21-1]